MKTTTLYSIGGLAALFAASIAAFGQAPPFAAKPAASENAKTWTPQRTADGQPDLQGIWSDAINKPFERPKELGAKEFYTEAEAAALAKKGYKGDRGGPREVHYDFSQYGMDAMQAKFAPDLRTSLVVGPEGRGSPMLPEAVKRNAESAAKH